VEYVFVLSTERLPRVQEVNATTVTSDVILRSQDAGTQRYAKDQ
jgi:hypothetical protein